MPESLKKQLIPPPIAKTGAAAPTESDGYATDFDAVFGNPERDASSALYNGPPLTDTADTNLSARSTDVAVGDATSAAAAAKDAIAADAATASTDATATTTAAPAATDVTATPAATATAAVQADAKPDATATAQPAAAPAAKTYAADEKFEISEGVVATREQLSNLVRNYGALNSQFQPLQERVKFLDEHAQTYFNTFGVDAPTAAKTWGPLIQSLRDDPEKAEYLEKAIAYYEQEKGATQPAVRQPQHAQLPPEEARRIEYINARVQEIDRERANTAVQEQYRSALAQYPQLADQQLLSVVANHARVQYDATGGRYSLADAVRDLSGLIQRYAAPVAQTAVAAPAVAAQPVPALNGSGGASPSGARRVALPAYDSTVDPVEDWMQNAAAYGFAS